MIWTTHKNSRSCTVLEYEHTWYYVRIQRRSTPVHLSSLLYYAYCIFSTARRRRLLQTSNMCMYYVYNMYKIYIYAYIKLSAAFWRGNFVLRGPFTACLHRVMKLQQHSRKVLYSIHNIEFVGVRFESL